MPFEVFDDLNAAFKRGAAFWEGVTLYGARVTIRLGDLGGIVQNSAEQMALKRAEIKADKAEDAIDGFD